MSIFMASVNICHSTLTTVIDKTWESGNLQEYWDAYVVIFLGKEYNVSFRTY